MNEIQSNRLKLYRLLRKFSNEKAIAKDIVVIDKVLKALKDDKSKHFVSFSKDGHITYAANKEAKLDKEKRISTTIGRYFRRNLQITGTEFNDTSLARFTEFMTEKMIDAKDKVKILTGKDLKRFYVEVAPVKCSSCMVGNNNADKISFFADNPERIALAVSDDHSTRALIFTGDNGKRIMSRIYGRKYVEMKAWATKNKILVRESLPHASKALKNFRVTVNYKQRIFPSVDNFGYAMIDSLDRKKKQGTIILSADTSFGNITLHSGAGGYTEVPMCVSCNKNLRGDYNYHNIKGKQYCNKCVVKLYAVCHCCNVFTKKTQLITVENKILSALNIKKVCKMCFDNKQCENLTCTICKKFFNRANCIQSSRDYDKCICLSCIKKI